MKRAHELTHDELVALVDYIQKRLFLDTDNDGATFHWTMEKRWPRDYLRDFAGALALYGLAPLEATPYPNEESPRKHP
jgi:hypothetical protein